MSRRPPDVSGLADWPGAHDRIPDVRDGLTRVQRIVLWQLYELRKEFPGRTVPTAVLYGRVVEQGVSLTPEELSRMLGQLGAMSRDA